MNLLLLFNMTRLVLLFYTKKICTFDIFFLFFFKYIQYKDVKQ